MNRPAQGGNEILSKGQDKMGKKLKKATLFAFLFFLTSPVLAQDTASIDTIKNVFSIQLMELRVSTVDTLLLGSNYPLLFPVSSIIGLKGGVSFKLEEKSALTISLFWGTGSGKFVDSTGRKFQSTVKAWGGRVGVDRREQLTNNLAFFGGPGIQLVSAHSKFTDEITSSTPKEFENPSATTYSLAFRMGITIQLDENASIQADFGPLLSYTSAKVRQQKISVWRSNHDISMGVAFSFQ